jgi:hypothetical protein
MPCQPTPHHVEERVLLGLLHLGLLRQAGLAVGPPHRSAQHVTVDPLPAQHTEAPAHQWIPALRIGVDNREDIPQRGDQTIQTRQLEGPQEVRATGMRGGPGRRLPGFGLHKRFERIGGVDLLYDTVRAAAL